MKAILSVTQAVKTTITVLVITFIFLETVLRLYHFVNPLFVFPDNSDNRYRGKPYGDDYDHPQLKGLQRHRVSQREGQWNPPIRWYRRFLCVRYCPIQI
jgi:hypothetical protein